MNTKTTRAMLAYAGLFQPTRPMRPIAYRATMLALNVLIYGGCAAILALGLGR